VAWLLSPRLIMSGRPSGRLFVSTPKQARTGCPQTWLGHRRKPCGPDASTDPCPWYPLRCRSGQGRFMKPFRIGASGRLQKNWN